MNTEPPPFPSVTASPKKRDYLIPSILTTLLCCLPFGVVAIVCSVRANSAYEFGKFDEADRYSRQAFWWMIAGAVSGFLAIAAYILIVALAMVVPAIVEGCGNTCEPDVPAEEIREWTLPEGEVM